MTDDEIREALQLSTPELVDDVIAAIEKSAAVEADRSRRLDTKALSLLTSVGISLTVLFALAPRVAALKTPHPNQFICTVVLLSIGVLASFGSAIVSVLAVRISDGYVTTSERAIFNKELLWTYDAEPSTASREYRRYLAFDRWIAVRRQQDLHDRRAKLVGVGQLLFLTFIGAVGLTSAAAVFVFATS